MFHLLSIVSLVSTVAQAVKEGFTKPIPAENWENKELYHKDLMSGVPVEQRMKNLKNGKYKLTENYPEPHRDPVSGKIVIENCKLYNEDLSKYGAVQTMKWVKQGKYNLTPEELEQERERIRKKFDHLYGLL